MIYQPIKEIENEQYRTYFDYANIEYQNVRILKKYLNLIKKFKVSNEGNVIFNGKTIQSTLVSNGSNKGIFDGKYNHYREILFYDLPIKRYAFFTYRLVTEVWCSNPDPKKYTTVHHIGNDSFDNKNNLLFVTNKQYFSIKKKNEY